MTFMRKILDTLNMENWKDSNNSKEERMVGIRNFWKSHPQTYQNRFQEASIEEYLLYGKTIMLWGFTKAVPLYKNFPFYYESECHINNPKRMQSQLLQEGYIESASINEILSTYKIQELKIIAASVGCSKSGRKIELIHRILNFLDKETIDTIRHEACLYVLSNKGRIFLQANYDYIELHRHTKYNISLHEFNKNRFSGDYRRTFEDNVSTLISQRIYRNHSQYYYHMMEYDYRTMYEIAISEHLYDAAIDFYLRSLYLRSCCIRDAEYYGTNLYCIENDFSNTIIFTVHSASPFVELGQFYTSSLVDNIYADLSLPPSFLNAEEFKLMVIEMIESITFDYNKYNQIIISRLKEYSKL